MCCNKNQICRNHMHPLQLHMVTVSHHPAGCSSSHVPCWARAAAVMPSILPSAQRTSLLEAGLQKRQASHTGQVCYQIPGQLFVGFMQVQGHQKSTCTKAVCSVEEMHQTSMQISSRHAHAVLPTISDKNCSSATLLQIACKALWTHLGRRAAV